MSLWLSVHGLPPFELRPGVDVTIGRGHGCTISLYSSMLSREHACIRWENGIPVLFDLDSLNGTFVGLDRIRRHVLAAGDVIRLAGEIPVLFTAGSPPPSEATPAPAEVVPEEEVVEETGSETRIFSRQAYLHQKAYEYDELGWLRAQLGDDLRVLRAPELGNDDVAALVSSGAASDGLFWRLLALGVLRPRGVDGLRGLPPAQAGARCTLTKRGERLRQLVLGQAVVWNELATLRYQMRQGDIFRPVRLVARAYRPGRGLDEVDVARLVDEIKTIYGPELPPAEVDAELSRLLVLGFLAPAPTACGEAWFPDAWPSAAVVISRRGRALMEAFRLEADDPGR